MSSEYDDDDEPPLLERLSNGSICAVWAEENTNNFWKWSGRASSSRIAQLSCHKFISIAYTRLGTMMVLNRLLRAGSRRFCSSWSREVYLDLPNEARMAYLKESIVAEAPGLVGLEAGGLDIPLARVMREDVMLLRGKLDEGGGELAVQLGKAAASSVACHYSEDQVVLRQVTTDTVPETSLCRIARAEAVLSNDVEDLKQRLTGARRVYALFHRGDTALDDPIAFIHAALAPEIASSIDDIMALTPDAALAAQTVTFYSVNVPSRSFAGNTATPTHTPLLASSPLTHIATNTTTTVGLDMGRRLIHAVASHLHDEFTPACVLSTLSPVPGLRAHIEADSLAAGQGQQRQSEGGSAMLAALQHDPAWFNDAALRAQASPWLAQQTARFLVDAKAEDGTSPADPVFRFHLRNGAKALYRINVHGSTSPVNMAKSFGVLVNYLYHGDVGAGAGDGRIQSLQHVPVSAAVADIYA